MLHTLQHTQYVIRRNKVTRTIIPIATKTKQGSSLSDKTMKHILAPIPEKHNRSSHQMFRFDGFQHHTVFSAMKKRPHAVSSYN